MNFLTKKILIISVAIIAFTGVVPSVLYENWDWLSRSGSLLTVYGIYLAFSKLTENLRPTREIKILKELEEIDKIPKEKLTYQQLMHKAVHGDAISKHLAKERVREKNHLADEVESSVEYAELFVLVAGTIIWGYGNLVCCLFSQCQ